MVHDAIVDAPYVSFRFLNLMAVRLKPPLQRFLWWLQPFHSLKQVLHTR